MRTHAIGPEPRRPVVADQQRRVYAEGLAFALGAERRLPLLKRAARILSRGDKHLASDMVQEALIDLWERDVTRFDEADEKVLRRVLYDRMRFVRMMEREDRGGKLRVERDLEELVEEEFGEPSEEMRAVFEEEEESSIEVSPSTRGPSS
jgi:DNA-directed RNA polymerase specialized sigma24 family protein